MDLRDVSMSETALLLGHTRSLVGIITDSSGAEGRDDLPGIILLNAGVVHRVGPNRLYVKLARNLAASGFTVLRFDFSGIGDSAVRDDHLPYTKSAVSETQAAMNYLQATKGIQQFVLMGICSGALVSFSTACCDARVVGAVLINSWGHLHDLDDHDFNSYIRTRALARHYWRIALFSSFKTKNWLKALTGKVNYRTIVPVMMGSRLKGLFTRGAREPSVVMRTEEDLRRLADRGVRLLHVYSEGDEGLDYFQMMVGNRLREWSTSALLEVEIIRGANHTFTLLWSQEHLVRLICNWAQAMAHEQGH
jgi:pimeloyl-ACP methyl ester carboxylesterase